MHRHYLSSLLFLPENMKMGQEKEASVDLEPISESPLEE